VDYNAYVTLPNGGPHSRPRGPTGVCGPVAAKATGHTRAPGGGAIKGDGGPPLHVIPSSRDDLGE
jgi:hypothetical protein